MKNEKYQENMKIMFCGKVLPHVGTGKVDFSVDFV